MKKGLLSILVVTFCLSAFLGILIIILDLWNDLTERVLLTTFVIFCFSIPSLCCSSLYEKKNHNVFAVSGMIFCILSCLYILGLIYNLFDDSFDVVWRTLFSCITISISFGHISLLLLINSKDDSVNTSKHATIAISIILDFMIIFGIWIEDNFFVWQMYAIAGILVALGTIVTPILHKMKKSDVEVQGKISDSKLKEDFKPTVKDLDLLLYLKNKGYILDEEFEKISSRIDKKDS